MTPRAGWTEWLARLTPAGLHGSTLLDAMIEHAAGRWYVGPSDADDALRAGEAAGVIVRGRLCPTVSQAAFAGLGLSQKGYAAHARFYASHWWWLPGKAG